MYAIRSYYGKATVAVSEALSVYGDLQLRRVHYETDGVVEESAQHLEQIEGVTGAGQLAHRMHAEGRHPDIQGADTRNNFV